jgi:hypothetical protein
MENTETLSTLDIHGTERKHKKKGKERKKKRIKKGN